MDNETPALDLKAALSVTRKAGSDEPDQKASCAFDG